MTDDAELKLKVRHNGGDWTHPFPLKSIEQAKHYAAIINKGRQKRDGIVKIYQGKDLIAQAVLTFYRPLKWVAVTPDVHHEQRD